MSIDDIVQLYESAEIEKIDRFCIENGLSLERISRQDAPGKVVEAGEEIVAVYSWKAIAEHSDNLFNSISFNKWREDSSINLFEMQLNEEIFNRFMNELGSNKAFKKYYLRRKNGKDRRFIHLTNKIDLQFMHRQNAHPFMPDYEYYAVVITRHYKYVNEFREPSSFE
jgi:hypothetical protein